MAEAVQAAEVTTSLTADISTVAKMRTFLLLPDIRSDIGLSAALFFVTLISVLDSSDSLTPSVPCPNLPARFCAARWNKASWC